jgi:hypothetical protein
LFYVGDLCYGSLMTSYEGYAEDFAALYASDYDAGFEFYNEGGRIREYGGVQISHQFDQGYSDARAEDQDTPDPFQYIEG